MRFRKAKTSDVSAIAALLQEFWKHHERCDPLLIPQEPMTLLHQAKHAERMLKKRNVLTLVAETATGVVGYAEVQLRRNLDGFQVNRYGYIDLLVIHSDERGSGIGRSFVEEIVRHLEKQGITILKTNVYFSNEAALAFWRKMGFKDLSVNLVRS